MAINDWRKPDNNSDYNVVLDKLKELIYKCSTLMQDTGYDTYIPTGAIRWFDPDSTFQKYTGYPSGTWVPLSLNYDMNVSNLDGKTYDEIMIEAHDATKLKGVVRPSHIEDDSHGDRGNGSLHTVATQSEAGFISSRDKTKLDNMRIYTDNDIASSYNSAVSVPLATVAESCIEHDPSSPAVHGNDTRRYSPLTLYNIILGTMTKGIRSLKFDRLFTSTSSIDIEDGTHQSYTIASGGETLSFTVYPGKPYVMYLYLTCDTHNVAELPVGNWENGNKVILDKGLCLVTVHCDGTNYYYSALKDMK